MFLIKNPLYSPLICIFSSVKSENDTGYGETAERMVSLAADQPGFLGVESVREADGRGITVSYWDSMDAINHWKHHSIRLVPNAFSFFFCCLMFSVMLPMVNCVHTVPIGNCDAPSIKKRLVRVVCSPRRKNRKTAAVSGEHE